MSYSPLHAARSTLIYGYGSTVATVANPQAGDVLQPIDTIVEAGATDFSGDGITFVADTLQSRSYGNAINPPFRSVLHLNTVIDMNIKSNVNYNDYATYYALTTNYDYRQDVSQFEVTSTFYDGGNKNLLTVTDAATFTRLEGGERLGYLFHSAASNSNDMVVPYSRLYGWSVVR